ncbi:MAG TPA: hypothetical protein PLA71_00955 [Saccharofermentans sp.]|nr:hypothetical protein [Saccharofermentans sp.]
MKIELDLPEECCVDELVLSQPPDCCQNRDTSDNQRLKITFMNNGVATFPRFSTKLWSMNDAVNSFTAIGKIANDICAHNDAAFAKMCENFNHN